MSNGDQIFQSVSKTNLAGVQSIRLIRPEGLPAQTHAQAITSELLAGPIAHQDLQIDALRRRLLEVEWPDDARIVPQLTPQIGITHPLTTRDKVQDTAFTSNNWAGSTISGTWAHAVGIWQVPTISRPSSAPGTNGGWDSSSWVGIDGTYGSNDVLQAGV
ncbi:MAG: G1 family glutamic endopeptidase, partial [Allobranchiibius sp.]